MVLGVDGAVVVWPLGMAAGAAWPNPTRAKVATPARMLERSNMRELLREGMKAGQYKDRGNATEPPDSNEGTECQFRHGAFNRLDRRLRCSAAATELVFICPISLGIVAAILEKLNGVYVALGARDKAAQSCKDNIDLESRRRAAGDFLSDIKIEFSWWGLVLVSPLWGWPGLFAGAVVGAVAWRKRPIAGGAIGALAGNFLCALTVVYFR